MYSPAQWLNDADENLKAAILLQRGHSSPRMQYLCAFIAVELALKAVAVALGNFSLKHLGHDAIKIWGDGLARTRHFKEKDLLLFTDVWFKALRYPSERTANFSIAQTKKAMDAAQRIVRTSHSVVYQIRKSLDPVMKWNTPS